MPRVSVIVPAWNAAAYIGECLASALAQDHRDLEVLVVDDASGDDTADRVALEARRDSRIRLLRHPRNLGVSAARNTAIAAASGDLIAFLDADDRWLPGKISRQLAALGAEPDAGLVFTASRAIDARGAVIDPDLCRGKAIPVGRVDLRDFVIRRYPLITSSAMVRRPCLDAVGGFDTAIAVGEDFDLWARILNQFPQAYVPEPLTDYRMHGDGATANPLRNRLSKVRVLEKLRGDPAFDRLTRDPAFTRHQHRQYLGAARLLAAEGRGAEADALYRKALALDIPWHARLATRLRRLRHG
ncbi:MAG: glycosyltransferase family A protein [Porticoccaceae bacterium]|jgi:glycosyltransferase involved in cell wall biosynthesis|nr:glycosyltransferase family A protein [Porticoccaceae bacterium]MEA3299934.1 glycosyltransferase family A protein [Pseudomonadota bacterium]HLS97094.1 glycosyltransferase family A protein [Porticoccaceae bacterium]